MNAERLHAIVLALKKEMDEKNLVGLMNDVVTGLRAIVQSPNATTQQNFSVYINSLYEALTNSEVDQFSPTWKQIVREIGGENLFGTALLQEIQRTIAQIS